MEENVYRSYMIDGSEKEMIAPTKLFMEFFEKC